MFRDTLRPLAHTLRSLVGTNGLADRIMQLEATLQARSAADDSARAASVVVRDTVDEPVAIARETISSNPAAALDINQLLHDSRGAFLRAMPPGATSLLSAGCAGLWYFDWIEQTYGRVPEHLGIEYYSPRPEGLPSNVTWIANTASDMSAVENERCDLVFSGQNLEHMWPEEVAGFALEAARVLRPGGHLVMDSPNRSITRPLNWSHPEHTIELTPTEACELIQLAGFEVTSAQGIWLCRDPRSGALLPFDPNQSAAGWSVTERLLAAREHPENSFIWWIEAVRGDREPDRYGVHAHMERVFRKHWPERVQRLIVPTGRTLQASPQGEWVVVQPGEGGVVMFGPYMPLRAGHYRVSWQVQADERSGATVATCDVVKGAGAELLGRCDVGAGEQSVSIEFALTEMTFGLQFRCISLGTAGFRVLRAIELDESGGDGGSGGGL